MKKTYLMPAIRTIEIRSKLMQFTSGEQDTTPVDPDNPKEPDEAMSRAYHGFSLWDEE